MFLSQSELHIVRKVKKEEIETSIVSMFENRIESIDITHARISAGHVCSIQDKVAHDIPVERQDPVYHFG